MDNLSLNTDEEKVCIFDDVTALSKSSWHNYLWNYNNTKSKYRKRDSMKKIILAFFIVINSLSAITFEEVYTIHKVQGSLKALKYYRELEKQNNPKLYMN